MAQQTVVVDVALLGKMTGYIEMLVKDPQSTVFAALSDIYRTFGLYQEAVEVAQRGSEMVPTFVPGFVALGRALAENGDPVAASGAYQRALALDPVNLAALTGLASSCLGCGQSEEALALLTRAQLIDPHDEVVKQLFPVVKKLAAISSPAVSSSPQDSVKPLPPPPPSEEIEIVREEEVDRATAAVPLPPIATATLADIYIKQGFVEKALKVFSDLLSDDPENTEIRQRYDVLYQQINGTVEIKSPEAVTVLPAEVEQVEVELISGVADLPGGTGQEALIALYGRWLDAVNRRQADVH